MRKRRNSSLQIGFLFLILGILLSTNTNLSDKIIIGIYLLSLIFFISSINYSRKMNKKY